jgi:hemerythrin-like domain-containing protein
MDGLDLLARDGLPDGIAALRARFPREEWDGHPRLGPVARFWLERHRMFRQLGSTLAEGSAAVAAERVDPGRFMAWFAPRLHLYLGELRSHHAVEDHHYFPVFRAAEPRLARGFEILDADHHAIDTLIRDLADAATGLRDANAGHGEVARAADALVASLSRGLSGIDRHLDDEEDLVVPLILHRTEGALGIL